MKEAKENTLKLFLNKQIILSLIYFQFKLNIISSLVVEPAESLLGLIYANTTNDLLPIKFFNKI